RYFQAAINQRELGSEWPLLAGLSPTRPGLIFPDTCRSLLEESDFPRTAVGQRQSATRSCPWTSLDHFVNPRQKIPRDGNTEFLRGLEVEDQLELGGLNNRQLERFRAFEDARGVDAQHAGYFHEVRTIAHEPACFREFAARI